jgi:tetratricopeptide (TPR) repeat protein
MHEEQAENYSAALETTAKLLSEDPTDEGTWSELERLARVANAEQRLAEIFATELDKIAADEPSTARLSQRTGELFEAHGNAERALTFFRRAHAFDPEAKNGTFEAIDRLLREAKRPKDRVQLFRDSLDHKHEPADRLEALHTIALIEEAELEDDAAAIETYRATLEVDDEDAHALEALSRLYARTGRWRDLADMTRRRAEQSALPEDEARFRLELARLLLGQLEESSAGIDELEAVVELAPPPAEAAVDAVRVLEELLQTPQHKARVVELLRPIYERADDWRHLVGVNGERLALATDDSERIAILRETAELWEKRGGDRGRAFEAMREAWMLDPEDGEAREHLDRLAGETKQWDALASAYEVAIGRTDGLAKRELLGALARLHDQRRDDPRRALEAWDRLFSLDETELQPLEEMDGLATLLSDWATLVRILVRKAELVPDDETRASTWRRVGEAKRDMLDDVQGAVDAYERALELEPQSTFTLDNLIALHEQRNDAARLVDLYRRRVELCGEDDDGLKFQLLVDAAGRFESDLSDRREAIEALTQALVVRPGDGEVLRRLDGLYTQERLWPELLDNLRLQAGAATDENARRGLKKRIAALHAVELQDAPAALEAYRDVLETGFDAEAAAAIRSIGEGHEELRSDAADALEPVLRAAGRFDELFSVLELRLRAQTEAPDRTRTLRAMAEVAETSLGDPDRAETALLRALAEDPQDPSLHADIERLAGRVGGDGWKRYADALQERAGSIFEANVASDLFVRLGRVAEDKLEDASRASKAYVLAVERMGDDAGVLAALDRLFARLGDERALADVLERRIAVEGDTGVQADLLHRLATLQIDHFGERSQGLATLRQALERAPGHAASRASLERLLDDEALFDDAFDALEYVLRTLGLSEDLAKLYERRVSRARTVRDRTHARLELAKVFEERAGDLGRAQRAIEAAIAEDPADDQALQELERLASTNSAWAEAADALGASLDASTELQSGTRTELWVRLAGWRRDKLGDTRRAEEAFAKALAIDPENVEVLRSLEDIRRVPGRERELVHTLRTRARLEGDVATKRELLREAKALAEGPVGDLELAESVLQDLIAEDEGDVWALEELTRLRGLAGDDAEVVRLLLRRAELVVDGAEAVSLKHVAATVVLEKLRDTERATTLYEEILEADASDARAAAALRTLYAAAGRYKDLAKLLSSLVDVATTQGERAALRLELALLQKDRFAAPDEAIDTLRGILDEEPTHPEAVLRLSQLYEHTGRDAELAELLKAQLDAARDRGDVDAELALLVRLGDVQEGRLGDATAAQETYEKVLERDAEHRGALEAVARISEKRSDWERAAGAQSKLLDLSTDRGGVDWALRLAESREKLGDPGGVEDALQRGLRLEQSNAELRSMLRGRYEKAEKWAELAELLVGDADVIAAAHPDDRVIPVEVPKAAGRSIAPPGASMPPPPAVPQSIADQVKLLRAAAEIHLARRKRAEDAIPVLERATQLVPHDRELMLALCDAYNAAQRGRDAAHVLEKVIASFGNRRTKELAVYHHRLAKALSQLGDKDLALAQLDMAFKIDPGSVSVLRDLGVLAFETNDLDRAQKTFRALLLQRLDPSSGISKGEVFYYLGEISAKQGDRAKAVQMFERAVENDPGLARAKAKLVELKG